MYELKRSEEYFENVGKNNIYIKSEKNVHIIYNVETEKNWNRIQQDLLVCWTYLGMCTYN